VLPTVLCHCLGNRALEISETMNGKAWPRTASDYDMLCGIVDKFHGRTKKLSEALEFPAVVLPIAFSIAAGLFFAILALGHRPPALSHPSLDDYMPRWLSGILMCICLATGFQAMLTPAHLTSNCNAISDAINSNRVKKESGEVRFAVPENLTRIIAVERYLETMKVGFWAYGIEISETFVLGLLVKLGATLLSVAPIVLLLANVPSLRDIQWCAAHASHDLSWPAWRLQTYQICSSNFSCSA
jgi:hypothetical protein